MGKCNLSVHEQEGGAVGGVAISNFLLSPEGGREGGTRTEGRKEGQTHTNIRIDEWELSVCLNEHESIRYVCLRMGVVFVSE